MVLGTRTEVGEDEKKGVDVGEGEKHSKWNGGGEVTNTCQQMKEIKEKKNGVDVGGDEQSQQMQCLCNNTI